MITYLKARPCALAIQLILLGFSTPAIAVDVANLDNGQGQIIEGASEGDRIGFAVDTGGDVNGDGINDIVVGSESGAPYVVFGKPGADDSMLSLSDIDGSNGFAITNEQEYGVEFGYDVNISGDLNADGLADIVIGAPASGDGNRGRVFVLYGSQQSTGASVDVSTLDGRNGFGLYLHSGYNDNNHRIGHSVDAGGDINGDGVDDLIIGAPNTSDLNDDNYYGGDAVGRVYVVYGKAGARDAMVDMADARRRGDVSWNMAQYANTKRGVSVAYAGDWNDDGRDDVLVGNGLTTNTWVYIMYGQAQTGVDAYRSFYPTGLDIRNDIPGYLHKEFEIENAGDLNNDGTDDVLLAPRVGNTVNQTYYVVFGHHTPNMWNGELVNESSRRFDLSDLDGENGFQFLTPANGNGSDFALAGGGDFNGDGIDDMFIGRSAEASDGETGVQGHIVFGRDGAFPDKVDSADLIDGLGIVVNGLDFAAKNDAFSASLDADINGDNIADLVIGVPTGSDDLGTATVIYGCTAGPIVSEKCPNTVFENGYIYNGEIQYTKNTCATPGKVCGSVYTYAAGGFVPVECVGGKWSEQGKESQTENADDACPNTVISDKLMWSASIELGPNSCATEGATCASTYHTESAMHGPAVCNGGIWIKP